MKKFAILPIACILLYTIHFGSKIICHVYKKWNIDLQIVILFTKWNFMVPKYCQAHPYPWPQLGCVDINIKISNHHPATQLAFWKVQTSRKLAFLLKEKLACNLSE